MTRAARWFVLTLAVTSCKITERVTAPPGEPTLIVQGVLNPVKPNQFVLVERAIGNLRARVADAVVRMTHLNPAPSCPAATVTLGAVSPKSDPEWLPHGNYMTSDLCPLIAGDRVTLRVEVGGSVVTGTTRIPGVRSVQVRLGGNVAPLPPASVVLDRTRDSVAVALDGDVRGLQLEVLREGWGQDARLDLMVDTMRVTIPADLADPFNGTNGTNIFRAGGSYLLTVAASDTNYFDFVRSGSNPFTGRGFINHLEGGIGVFGSIMPTSYRFRVVAPQSDPREGRYHVTGTVAGTPVDVMWDVYLDSRDTFDGFSALVDGRWVQGTGQLSADGNLYETDFNGLFPVPDPNSADGRFFYHFSGRRTPQGTPFKLAMYSMAPAQRIELPDTLTAVQVSGPR